MASDDIKVINITDSKTMSKLVKRDNESELKSLEVKLNEGLKGWKTLIEESRNLLINCNKESPFIERKMKLELCQSEVMALLQPVVDLSVNNSDSISTFSTIEKEHFEIVRTISERIRLFDCLSERSSSKTKSVISRRSTISSVYSQKQKTVMAKADLDFTIEEAKLKYKLEELKLKREVEKSKSLHLLESSESETEEVKSLRAEAPVFQPNIVENKKEVVYVTAPRLTLPTPDMFTGDIIKYPVWRTSFDTLIIQSGVASTESLYYLKQYVSGKALECIEGFFLINTPQAFNDAMAQLDERFGNPIHVGNAFRKRLFDWQIINKSDSANLRKFSDYLKQCLTAQSVYPSLTILNDELEIMKVLSKLPDWLISRWGRIVYKHKKEHLCYPPFANLVEFIATEAEIACEPVSSLNTIYSYRKDTKTQSGESKPNVKPVSNGIRNNSRLSHVVGTQNIERTCLMCKQKYHNLDYCEAFNALQYEKKQSFIKDNNLCFGCLKGNHRIRNCKRKLKCKTCEMDHPTSMHRSNDNVNMEDKRILSKETATSEVPLQNVAENKYSFNAYKHKNYSKCSMIVPVEISHKSDPDIKRVVYALLDTQSCSSFILQKTVDELNVCGTPVNFTLSTLGGEDQLIESLKVTGLQVKGLKCETVLQLPPVFTRDMIPANRDHIPTASKLKKWSHLHPILDEIGEEINCDIALLIGYDCPKALIPLSVIPSENDQVFGQLSHLGWGAVGLINDVTDTDAIGHSCRTISYEVLHANNIKTYSAFSFRTTIKEVFTPLDMVKRLELDFKDLSLSSKLCDSIEDKRFVSLLENGTKINENNRYEIPLPFKSDALPDLPCNKKSVATRLEQLKKRLLRDENYHNEYTKFMSKIISSGFAEKVDEAELATNYAWFIPHHGVFQKKKPDKLRVVFDASAKYQSFSLNNMLLTGPDMSNSLLGVLLRFRKEHVAFSCDVQQMFYQFFVPKEQRNLLCFFWWENGDLNKEPVIYHMTVHLFGAASSPGCANFGLKQIVKDYGNEANKEVCKFINSNFYVDDGLTSVNSVNEAVNLIEGTRLLLDRGGLKLHKFVSNSPEVLKRVNQNSTSEVKTLPIHESCKIERALGIEWCTESDRLNFDIVTKERSLTRRGLLSMVSAIYDPIGLLGPCILEGKQILQELCKLKNSDWDDVIPECMIIKWKKWYQSLSYLRNLTIQRCYKLPGFGPIKRVEFHHYSDASMSAYGQCSYVRLIDESDNVNCYLIMSKCRVAPIKSVTVPRLELTAAVLSVKVSLFLRKELDYDNIKEFYWSDSKAVLGYINNTKCRYHIFVSNRLQMIHDHTETNQWHYVPTAINPADLASRGLSPKKLEKSRWFKGPEMLWNRELEFFDEHDISVLETDVEVKHCNAINTKDNLCNVMERYSSWQKLRRIIATCLRFKNILKCDESVSRSLSVDEIDHAGKVIIIVIQNHFFEDELTCLKHKRSVKLSSPLSKLNAFLDESGIIRVGGRLSQSSHSYDEKHPIVIPNVKKCHVSRLIIEYYHSKVAHQGRGITVNEIRSNGYWILGCVSAVASVIHHCVHCKRLYKNTHTQIMSDLPADRLAEVSPFTFCATDAFGPFLVKEGRRTVKRYGLIFTCLSCRAVHVETVNSLSSDSFINAFRRLTAIRGHVAYLRSDCGTNFVGSEKELQLELVKLDHGKVKSMLSKNSCEYTQIERNVPHASHAGGVWERQIRSIRRVFISLLKSSGSQLDDESLRTFLCESAAIINNRPLTVDNLSDVNSLLPLSPNDILLMKSKVILPPKGTLPSDDMYCKMRWRRVQYLVNQFWLRWRKEFLNNLQQRNKWRKPQRSLTVGDIVLIKNELVPRSNWSLGKVVDVYGGTDKHVRSAKLLVGSSHLSALGKQLSSCKYLERPIQKLVVLVEANNSSTD